MSGQAQGSKCRAAHSGANSISAAPFRIQSKGQLYAVGRRQVRRRPYEQQAAQGCTSSNEEQRGRHRRHKETGRGGAGEGGGKAGGERQAAEAMCQDGGLIKLNLKFHIMLLGF